MTRLEHLLTIAAEECAEVAQRLAKAQRFGMEQVQQDADDKPEENPERLTNRERVLAEFADLMAVLEMAGFELDLTKLNQRMMAKRERVERYLLRSLACGTLGSPMREPSTPSDAAVAGRLQALLDDLDTLCRQWVSE